MFENSLSSNFDVPDCLGEVFLYDPRTTIETLVPTGGFKSFPEPPSAKGFWLDDELNQSLAFPTIPCWSC